MVHYCGGIILSEHSAACKAVLCFQAGASTSKLNSMTKIVKEAACLELYKASIAALDPVNFCDGSRAFFLRSFRNKDKPVSAEHLYRYYLDSCLKMCNPILPFFPKDLVAMKSGKGFHESCNDAYVKAYRQEMAKLIHRGAPSIDCCRCRLLKFFKKRNRALRIPNTPSISFRTDSNLVDHFIVGLPAIPCFTGDTRHGQRWYPPSQIRYTPVNVLTYRFGPIALHALECVPTVSFQQLHHRFVSPNNVFVVSCTGVSARYGLHKFTRVTNNFACNGCKTLLALVHVQVLSRTAIPCNMNNINTIHTAR